MMKRIVSAFLSVVLILGTNVLPAAAAVNGALEAPTNIAVTDPTPSSLTIHWTDNSTTETDFVVYASTDGIDFNQLSAAAATQDQAGVGASQQMVFGPISPNTPYYFRVVAHDSTNTTTTLNDSAAVESFVPVYTLANSPLQPTIGDVGTSTIPLILDTSGNPTSTKYSVEWTDVASSTGSFVSLGGAATVNGLQSQNKSDWDASGLVNSLTPGKTYTFRIHAYNDEGVEGLLAFTNTPNIATVSDQPRDQEGPNPEPAPQSGGGGGSGTAVVYGPVPAEPVATAVLGTLSLTKNTVQFNVSATNNPTDVAFSVNKDFSSASWQPFVSPATWNFDQSIGGIVPVYVKFKNANGESQPIVVTLLVGRASTAPTSGQVLGEKITRLDELVATLSFGNRGAAVVELQNALKQLGLFPRYVRSTGYFGPITKGAVAKYLASK